MAAAVTHAPAAAAYAASQISARAPEARAYANQQINQATGGAGWWTLFSVIDLVLAAAMIVNGCLMESMVFSGGAPIKIGELGFLTTIFLGVYMVGFGVLAGLSSFIWFTCLGKFIGFLYVEQLALSLSLSLSLVCATARTTDGRGRAAELRPPTLCEKSARAAWLVCCLSTSSLHSSPLLPPPPLFPHHTHTHTHTARHVLTSTLWTLTHPPLPSLPLFTQLLYVGTRCGLHGHGHDLTQRTVELIEAR